MLSNRAVEDGGIVEARLNGGQNAAKPAAKRAPAAKAPAKSAPKKKA
jgi:hypothetical protein